MSGVSELGRRGAKLIGKAHPHPFVHRKRRRGPALRSQRGHHETEKLLVVRVLVEGLLRRLDAGGEVARRERCACNQVADARGQAFDSAAFLRKPRLVVERGMCEQRSRGQRSGKCRRRLSFAQTAVGLHLELGGRDQIDPVGVQRIAGVTVADARRAQNAAETAHEHGELRRWIAGLVIEPQDVGKSFHADSASLRDAKDAQGHSCLAAAELMLSEPVDREPVDDMHPQRARLSHRTQRRRALGAVHGTKDTCRGTARGKHYRPWITPGRRCLRRSSR